VLDGTPAAEVRRLVDYWRNKYDWRATERAINQQFKGEQFLLNVNVDGYGDLDIHYVHRKSSHPNAIPLLFAHGCEL